MLHSIHGADLSVLLVNELMQLGEGLVQSTHSILVIISVVVVIITTIRNNNSHFLCSHYLPDTVLRTLKAL